MGNACTIVVGKSRQEDSTGQFAIGQCFSDLLWLRHPYNNCSYPEETLSVKTKQKIIKRRLLAHGD